jgi:hypothetical protein
MVPLKKQKLKNYGMGWEGRSVLEQLPSICKAMDWIPSVT